MAGLDTTRPGAFGYWLLYGIVTLGVAIAVCIAAGYALLLLPAGPFRFAVVWFGGILALAAVPTVTERALTGSARFVAHHLDAGAPLLARGARAGADSRSGGCPGRVARTSGNRGCPCCDC